MFLISLLLFTLLLGIQHQTKNVESKFRKLQTHLSEFIFRLVSKYVTTMRPECRNGFSNRRVVSRCVPIDESSIGDLSFGSGIDAMDLRMRKSLKLLC